VGSLNFFVRGMLAAGLAKLADFQAVLMLFLIFCRRVIPVFANRTL
jgi:hypothetical protein